MSDRKLKRNLRELRSLRHRAQPHVYDRKIVDRKRRLRDRIRRLGAVESEMESK